MRTTIADVTVVPRQAFTVYADRLAACRALVAELTAELDRHAIATRTGASPVHWGHVGDLGSVRAQLAAVLAFLQGGDA